VSETLDVLRAEMTCQELVELVTEYLEGTLPPGEKSRFEAHLERCDGCTDYLRQMRDTIALTGSLATESISAGAREALLAAFRDWKRGAAQ
jgi:anti-sigma factor RsiW